VLLPCLVSYGPGEALCLLLVPGANLLAPNAGWICLLAAVPDISRESGLAIWW
jgi:hypothetical protein